MWVTVVLGSFCCSGQHQETRQAKDHPKAAYEAWHTAWRYPFRARRDWQSQAHLHTTLNKSRDEKLEIERQRVCPTYLFDKGAFANHVIKIFFIPDDDDAPEHHAKFREVYTMTIDSHKCCL